MESTLASLRKKYEYDREHNWTQWLTINGEVADKYGYRSYLFASYQDIIYELEYPTDEDLKIFQASKYNSNGYVPILLRGVVIDNIIDEDGECWLQLVFINEMSKYDSDTLLHLRDCANVYYTILTNALYANRAEYTIGDIRKVRPGENVIIAGANIAISPRNKKWIQVQFTDIARYLDKSEYTFLDKNYRIHQSEIEYLTLYESLARRKKADKQVSKDAPKHQTNPESTNEGSAQKGCLGKILKWIIILIVLSGLLSKCGSGASKTNSHDLDRTSISEQKSQGHTLSNTEASASNERLEPAEISELTDDVYELILSTSRDNINSILAKAPVDTDKLQSEYEFLLSLKIYEYSFKQMAYIHFTGEDAGEDFDDILSEIRTISGEMRQYFSDEEVDGFYKYMAVSSATSFDDSRFNYDPMLVGSEKSPNVDKMWRNYITVLVLNSGIDMYDSTSENNLALFPDSGYTESAEESKSGMPISQQPNIAGNGRTEGYVMYGNGGLNVRNGPGTSYEKVGRLSEGERVIIYETQYSGASEWGRIEAGWICMDYVEVAGQHVDDTTSVCMTVCVKPSAGELKIRSGPGSSYNEVGRLQSGEYATVTELQQNGYSQWGRIEIGWICMDYVDIITDAKIGDDDPFTGSWIEDAIANKLCSMTVWHIAGNQYQIEIQQSMSASETMFWDMPAEYDASLDYLEYDSCRCVISVIDGNGNSYNEVQYENGDGILYLSSGELHWQDYTGNIRTSFMPNEW